MAKVEDFEPAIGQALKDYLDGSKSVLAFVNAKKLSEIIESQPTKYRLKDVDTDYLRSMVARFLKREYGTATPIFELKRKVDREFYLTRWGLRTAPVEGVA